MKFLSPIAVCVFALAATEVQAAPITGTYTTGGATIGAGPWTMTSTNSTFSILRFVLDNPIPFSQVATLSVNYNAVQGGIGGGAPRFAVVYDSNNDNVADGQFLIYLGPSPSFVDPTLGPANSGNLLNNDAGRFDLSGSLGGSPSTNYSAALAAAGSYDVLRFSLVLDSFGGNDKTFIINSINATDNSVAAAAVPEPSTIALLAMILACALGCFLYQRRKTAPAA